ncbi:uncharacterized protein N7483_008893 [Penicillium malachiteum]|uniref:uncharacterized protein n=1 Tax=Penicillium malachiteum TaxID=1324776 RepID=UPI0025483C79|nr:uncharacterized protein N7483_008893 [Penicillium malachiteum]KAJ5720959.1 hypothetical protein N7483_008893 [Penicillium malachiteum]
MATPRLPFLYPNLMRAVRACQPKIYHSPRFTPTRSRFHTSRRLGQQAYQRRYGPAVAPNIPPPYPPKDGPPSDVAENADEVSKEIESKDEASPQPEQSAAPPQSQPQPESPPAEPEIEPAEAAVSSLSDQVEAELIKGNILIELEQTLDHEQEQHKSQEDKAEANSSSPSGDVGEEMSQMAPYANRSAFDEVYHMPSPSTYLTPTEPPDSERPPHMSPAPYVHHFDTYSLVQDLSGSGFTKKQSTTIMKAVRSILQNNLDFAKQGLTSKSDEENESYLFKAACSELQQSLQMARNSEVQRQRASRGQLEHETDILSQRLNQELAGMKDEIKGMFNDHKMTTREHQRSIDTSVQELNYKITVSLNSDGKSEIEGLRWILTRRAALAVAICAFMMIVFLKYASTQKVHEPPKTVKEVEKPVKEAAKETRVIHETGGRTEMRSISEIHLGESLG